MMDIVHVDEAGFFIWIGKEKQRIEYRTLADGDPVCCHCHKPIVGRVTRDPLASEWEYHAACWDEYRAGFADDVVRSYMGQRAEEKQQAEDAAVEHRYPGGKAQNVGR